MEPGLVYGHQVLGLVPPEDFHVSHVGYTQKGLLDFVVCQLSHLGQVQLAFFLGGEGQGDHGTGGVAHLEYLGRKDPLRQFPHDALQGVGHIGGCCVQALLVFELYRDSGDLVVAHRGHLPHQVYGAQLFLYGPGHLVLHVFGRGSRLVDDHADYGVVGVGEQVQGHEFEGDDSQGYNQEDDSSEEVGSFRVGLHEVHGFSPYTGFTLMPSWSLKRALSLPVTTL